MNRKNLHADYLYSLMRDCFCQIRDHKKCLGDALMSGLAVFALKKPSLLSFEKTIRANTPIGESLRNLFSIKTPASDTQMRAILDPISSKSIRSPFRKKILNSNVTTFSKSLNI